MQSSFLTPAKGPRRLSSSNVNVAVASIAGAVDGLRYGNRRELVMAITTYGVLRSGLTDTSGKTHVPPPTRRCVFSTIADNPGASPLTCNPTRVQRGVLGLSTHSWATPCSRRFRPGRPAFGQSREMPVTPWIMSKPRCSIGYSGGYCRLRAAPAVTICRICSLCTWISARTPGVRSMRSGRSSTESA